MTVKSFEEFATERTDLKDSDLVRMAEQRGYVIHKPQPQQNVLDFSLSRVRGKRVRLAIYSDTHLGSRYQQLTHLRHFAAYASEVGVDAGLHCGDVTDGPPEMHPGHAGNLFKHGYDAQRAYAIANLPVIRRGRKPVPTHVIWGNHDESWLKNNAGPIVEDICAAREDLVFAGAQQGYVRFGDVLALLEHPYSGIQNKGLSYKPQDLVNGMSPEHKPHLAFFGNWHKALHMPAYRNVEAFCVPSFQAQTPFMRGKGIASVVGGIILEFGVVTKGLAPSLEVEWVLEREPIPNDWPSE